MNTGPVVVDASMASLVAVLVAPLAGLLALLVRMVGRSGDVKMSVTVLRKSKADVAALAIYDVVGGAICVLGLLVLGITRPPVLVQGFHDQPVITWAVIGFVGPLVSAGFLDRLPLRSVVDFMARDDRGSERTDGRSALVEVRFQASRRILFSLYDNVRVRDERVRRACRVKARDLVDAGLMSFDDVAREVEQFARERKVAVPDQLAIVIEHRGQWPIGTDPGRETLRLVETSLEIGFTRAVVIACRIAEDGVSTIAAPMDENEGQPAASTTS